MSPDAPVLLPCATSGSAAALGRPTLVEVPRGCPHAPRRSAAPATSPSKVATATDRAGKAQVSEDRESRPCRSGTWSCRRTDVHSSTIDLKELLPIDVARTASELPALLDNVPAADGHGDGDRPVPVKGSNLVSGRTAGENAIALGEAAPSRASRLNGSVFASLLARVLTDAVG